MPGLDWQRVIGGQISGCGIAGNPGYEMRLFIKPYCGWCHKAMRWLDDHHFKYEKIDVIADAAAFKEMVRLSSQEFAPVLEVDGKILADFGPEQLPGFFEQLKS